MTATQNATVEDGVLAVREWQIGRPEYLDRFQKTSLTRKGWAHLRACMTYTMSEDQIREIVAEAVAMGY